MKRKNFNQKRKHINTEKKLDKTHYYIVMGLMILFVLHHTFLEAETIGHDTRYDLYVICVPVIIGMIALGYCRRDFLITGFIASKGFGIRLFMAGFYLLEGIVISFCSFGFLASVIWNYANKTIAGQNPKEVITCKVDKFLITRHDRIEFKFQGRYEAIYTDYQSIKDYKKVHPNNYQIEITAQKGLWNHYIVKDWTIINNNSE